MSYVDDLYAVPDIWSLSFNSNGEKLYFVSDTSGFPEAWCLSLESLETRQITFYEKDTNGVFPSPAHESLLCISVDDDGKELNKLYLQDIGENVTTRISPDTSSMNSFGAWSPDGRYVAYASNVRHEKYMDVYLYDIVTGYSDLLHKSDYLNYPVAFSPDGGDLVILRFYSGMDSDLFALHVQTHELRRVTQHEGQCIYNQPLYSQDGKHLYFTTDYLSDYTQIACIDLSNHNIRWITNDKWDKETLCHGFGKSEIAFTLNIDGSSESIFFRNLNDTTPSEKIDIPQGVVRELECSSDATSIAFILDSSTQGRDIWLLSRTNNTPVQVTAFSNAGIQSYKPLDAPELIHVTSFDGLKVPTFYFKTQPKKLAAIFVHGGPEYQFRNSYDPIIQLFGNFEINVFVPNIRGSTGYGKEYQGLDNGRLRFNALKDLESVVREVMSYGYESKSIAVIGKSYGAFMAAAFAVHFPNLLGACVSISGFYDLRSFLETTSPYRRHLREIEYGTVHEDGDFFDLLSPATNIDKLQVPVLVVHGINDTRVHVSEAENFVRLLQSRSKKFEFMKLKGEGHSFTSNATRRDVYVGIKHFLDLHIS